MRSEVYPDRWTAVYRLYDAADRLLYVGVGYDYLTRWKAHAKAKPWWPEVVRKDVIWYDNRLDAMYEEARAIRDEDPLHNDEEGISPFGFATFRVRNTYLDDPQMDFARDRLDPARVYEMASGRRFTAIAYEGDLAAVMVPLDWYRVAMAALGDPVDF